VLTIETVAVLGASEGGTACARLAALAGCAVRLHDPDPALLSSAGDVLRGRVDAALAEGTLGATERQRILDGILFTPDLDEALTGADLVVDAGCSAPIARLAESLRATAAVAAAGATAPADLASVLPQPGRVLALRLAAPGGAAPRVEVLPAPVTNAYVLEQARDFAARLNRAARLPGEAP
jgi:3-hydroxyacyl-CoA dehydrogenase